MLKKGKSPDRVAKHRVNSKMNVLVKENKIKVKLNG